MKNEVSEARLAGFLIGSERIIRGMINSIIEEVGRQNRVYLDEEDLQISRLEEALGHINSARFLVKQAGFRAEHETGDATAAKKK